MKYEMSNAAQFFTAYAGNQLDLTDVKVYAKPLGIVCHFYRDSAGNGHLISGNVTHDVNDPISQYLRDCDLDDGFVVISQKENTIRHGGSFSRWLNYALTYNPKDDSWLDQIVIYTPQEFKLREPALLRRLSELDEDITKLREAQIRLSINKDFDGLLVTAKHKTLGDRIYYFVPSRSTIAEIVGVINSGTETEPLVGGFIVKTSVTGPAISRVTRVPSSVYALSYAEAREYIGHQVVLEYTSAMYGDFLEVFSAATILEI